MDASDLVLYILAITFLGTIASVAIAFYVLHQLNKHKLSLHQMKLNQEMSESKSENFASSLTPMGHRILELEAKTQHLTDKIKNLQESQSILPDTSGHYKQARRIADLGGDTDTLMQDCGLTKIEAQMIQAMQKRAM